MNTLWQIFKAARPAHWTKNLALFAALVFTGNLFDKLLFIKVGEAFLVFCLATSATYIFNDIIDVKLDRLHPIKKNRPIASGKLKLPFAYFELFILIISSLHLSREINHLLFISISGYLFLQFFYSTILKNIPIIDILTIASGFIIRIYAGAFAINAHLSVWFLLCVISVALFLASGKRRSELNILEESQEITRKSLVRYKKDLLNSFVTMFGNASWLSWSIFTFFESPQVSTDLWVYLAEFSKTTAVNKLLMSTIPVVIFGIMQYEKLIFEGKTEAPEKLLLTDKGLVISIVVWIGMIIFIFYGGVSIR